MSLKNASRPDAVYDRGWGDGFALGCIIGVLFFLLAKSCAGSLGFA